ncbi:MAG TPA: right-handed parallel beta-helix repeat-containing protein [Rudaea sp.]
MSLAFAARGGPAATIVVTDGGDAGTASTCTLRQAIVSANKNAHGESTCVSGDNSDTIIFDDSLVNSAITLGGTELAVTTPMSILGSGQTIDANHASRVMYVGFTTFAASNISLANGSIPGNSGGGLFVLSSTVSLDTVVVSNNGADYAGGIAAFNYTNLTLNNCSISGNTASRKGGGIEIVNGTDVMVNDSIISGNGASRGGGAFMSFYGKLSLTRSSISGNSATGAPTLSGAGIYAYRCTQLSATDSTISGNTGNNRGGGILAEVCPLMLVNSTLTGNSASYGGAIYAEDGAASIVNSTISGNSAIDAAGILAYKANVTVANSIVSANVVDAGNEETADLDQSQSSVTAQYSLLGAALGVVPFDDPGDHNLFTGDPGLGPLQDNGGRTWTMALLDGSPAIDAGSNTLAQSGGNPLSSDQRAWGNRIYNSRVDIGAFESQGDRIFAGEFEQLP